MEDFDVVKISVFNSVVGKNFDLYIRKDRLLAFYDLVMTRRNTGEYKPEPPGMPGLSWSAIQGLDAIFERRPKKFPAHDIVQHFCRAGDATPQEIEKALEVFSTMYPPDVAESA